MEQDAYSGQASLYVSSSTTTCNDNEIVFNLTATDLCVYTVDMCGILLPMVPTKSLLLQQSHNHIISANTTSTTTTSLVHTPSTQQALQSVAMALSMKMPILLQGAPGVGKTSLVEEAHLICSRGQGPGIKNILTQKTCSIRSSF